MGPRNLCIRVKIDRIRNMPRRALATDMDLSDPRVEGRLVAPEVALLALRQRQPLGPRTADSWQAPQG